MTKQTKATASMGELSDVDKRLCAKLIAVLKAKLDPESRNSINRAINKARRGPNAASPEEKLKYVNGYTTFYKHAALCHLEKREEIDWRHRGWKSPRCRVAGSRRRGEAKIQGSGSR